MSECDDGKPDEENAKIILTLYIFLVSIAASPRELPLLTSVSISPTKTRLHLM